MVSDDFFSGTLLILNLLNLSKNESSLSLSLLSTTNTNE